MNDEKNILFVDDDLLFLNIGQILLQELGYDVTVAVDGYKALEVVKNQHIDLVLMDFHMPKLDGLETLKKMKIFDANRKVVISSGYVSSEQQQMFKDAGALGFLKKPYTRNQLTQMISSLI